MSHLPICSVHVKTLNPQPEDLVSSRNKKYLREFFYFCCQEYSVENLLAYLAIDDYKRSPTFAKANFIYSEFVNQSSNSGSYQINTSQSRANQVNSDIERYSDMHVYAKTPDRNLFNEVCKDIGVNLADTMARFGLAHMSKKLGVWYLWRVPPANYMKEIPKHIKVLRSMAGAGFQLSDVLAV